MILKVYWRKRLRPRISLRFRICFSILAFLGLGFWIPMFELAIRVLDCFVVFAECAGLPGDH